MTDTDVARKIAYQDAWGMTEDAQCCLMQEVLDALTAARNEALEEAAVTVEEGSFAFPEGSAAAIRALKVTP